MDTSIPILPCFSEQPYKKPIGEENVQEKKTEPSRQMIKT